MWGNLPFTLDKLVKLCRSDNQRFFSAQRWSTVFANFFFVPGDRSSSWHTLLLLQWKWSIMKLFPIQHWRYTIRVSSNKNYTKKLVLLQFPVIWLDILWVFQLDHAPLPLFPIQDVFMSLGIDYLCLTASGVTWFLTPVYDVFKPFSLKKF